MFPPKTTYILGISAFYHDSAAALIRDGEIVAAAQEERFTRKKHDDSFPKQAIAFCLKEAGISIKDLSFVAYYEKPFIKFERLLMTYLTCAPVGLQSFLMSMPIWLKHKLFLKDFMAEDLGYEGEILFCEHHEAHAASAFYPSPFNESAILTMDGVGEWATTSFGFGQGNEINIDSEIHFPHSLGLLYSAFTYFTGFRVNSGEYKLMGLAPYGEPKYVDLIKKNLVDIKEDGSIRLNMKYFDYCVGLTMTNKNFDQLFGRPPRRPETPISRMDMDIAHSIQDVTEEIMLKMARHVHQVTKKDNLCLAGGVALNCVGNGRILREGPFKNVWIQPAAGDAGGALGAALAIWYRYLGNKRIADDAVDCQRGSYLGPNFDSSIKDFVASKKVPAQYYDEQALAERVAKLLAEQKVVGLVRGRMEFGPRALGARSIIGDARSQEMQTTLNLKTKFRESFRPFAPSVLEEKVDRLFELKSKSPYMLLVAPIVKEKRQSVELKGDEDILTRLKLPRSVVPAITHVDYSARVQTVSSNVNPFYHAVIKAFDKITDCPAIINTSFNIRGEPIVCTPQDAYRCFMCTNMDYLVMGNYIFDKLQQPNRDQYKKDDISQVLD